MLLFSSEFVFIFMKPATLVTQGVLIKNSHDARGGERKASAMFIMVSAASGLDSGHQVLGTSIFPGLLTPTT